MLRSFWSGAALCLLCVACDGADPADGGVLDAGAQDAGTDAEPGRDAAADASVDAALPPTEPMSILGNRDTITTLTFRANPEIIGIDAAELEVAWDLGDGTTTPFGPPDLVEHHYLRLGDYPIVLRTRRTGTTTEETSEQTLTIAHPNYWPRIVPTYFIAGFTRDPVDEVIADPRNVRALMLAAFDYWRFAGGGAARQDVIDEIHGAGMLAYFDISQWNPPWSIWDDMVPIVEALVVAGVDGMSFDEFGNSGNPVLDPVRFNALRARLQAINPHFRMIVTQVRMSSVQRLVDAGGEPDYVALEWYLDGSTMFTAMQAYAADHGIRLAYWVDPSTYARSAMTYADADAVFMWNLCWRPGVCGSAYPTNTWVPWADAAPNVADLGPGLE